MSYSARFAQNQWNYDPNGTDFNARIGRLLANGQDLQATLKSKALANLTSNLEFEKQEKQSRGSDKMDAAAAINQCLSSSGRKQEPDTTGYVWVNEQGEYLGDLPQEDKNAALASTSAKSTLNRAQEECVSMSTVQRSMHMWRRVNPGCVEVNTKWKDPTYKEHYANKTKDAEKQDRRYYLQKTDFSEYTEAKVKQGGPMVDR